MVIKLVNIYCQALCKTKHLKYIVSFNPHNYPVTMLVPVSIFIPILLLRKLSLREIKQQGFKSRWFLITKSGPRSIKGERNFQGLCWTLVVYETKSLSRVPYLVKWNSLSLDNLHIHTLFFLDLNTSLSLFVSLTLRSKYMLHPYTFSTVMMVTN